MKVNYEAEKKLAVNSDTWQTNDDYREWNQKDENQNAV